MYFVLLFSEKITWPIIDFLTDSVATETSQKERCTGIELCPRPSAEQCSQATHLRPVSKPGSGTDVPVAQHGDSNSARRAMT